MTFLFVGEPLDGARREVDPLDDLITIDGADYTHSEHVVVEFYADEHLFGLEATEMLVVGYRKVDG